MQIHVGNQNTQSMTASGKAGASVKVENKSETITTSESAVSGADSPTPEELNEVDSVPFEQGLADMDKLEEFANLTIGESEELDDYYGPGTSKGDQAVGDETAALPGAGQSIPGMPDLDIPGIDLPDLDLPDLPIPGEGEGGGIPGEGGGAVPRPHVDGNRNVYVVDNFVDAKVDVDGDGVRDLTHGEMASEIIEAEDPNANVHRVHAGSDANGHAAALSDLAERKRNGEDIDAVNLSQGVNFDIESLGQSLGVELTNENIGEHKDVIMDYLENTEDPHFDGAYETILALEELTAAGVDVYVSGGNGGPGEVNTYNLADGTIDVGADDYLPYGLENDDPDEFSADNDLIDVEAQGHFTFTRVEGGYDINEDGVADLEGTFSAGDVELGTITDFTYGTSWSAPMAAAHQLK